MLRVLHPVSMSTAIWLHQTVTAQMPYMAEAGVRWYGIDGNGPAQRRLNHIETALNRHVRP